MLLTIVLNIVSILKETLNRYCEINFVLTLLKVQRDLPLSWLMHAYVYFLVTNNTCHCDSIAELQLESWASL
jgi:hypothetical protein